MSKKHFKIKPKVWPKEYTFEEFKRLNPNINESLLINYYNKYLQEYAENRSRFINYFNDNKKLLANNLQEVKNRYDDSQYFLQMYYDSSPAGGAGSYPSFTPTDINGLTHWFKAEPEFYETQDAEYNIGESVAIQEIVSWSNAANSDSFLTKRGAAPSGLVSNNENSIGFFRATDSNGGNTGGVIMELTDSPSFGTFTYFAVLELNSGPVGILANNATDAFDTASVIFQGREDAPLDRTILLQGSTTTAENYRIVFTNDQQNIVYSDFFSEQVLTASLPPVQNEQEISEGRVSGSTLISSLIRTINTIPFYTASDHPSGVRLDFVKYSPTSSYTGLPSDGNYHNALGDSENVIITSNFTGSSIIKEAGVITARRHGIWAGEKTAGQVDTSDNFMFLQSKPITITGSLLVKFQMAASSSKDSGDNTAIEDITKDPENNQKFVFMVTKDAPENALLKVYVNNESVFPLLDSDTEETNATGSLELDQLAHFEPKNFGRHNAQNRSLNGHVYEMGFYTGSLSDDDRAQLYYYLSLKHNIPGYSGPTTLQPYNYPDDDYLP